jgi:hypothetical protein
LLWTPVKTISRTRIENAFERRRTVLLASQLKASLVRKNFAGKRNLPLLTFWDYFNDGTNQPDV